MPYVLIRALNAIRRDGWELPGTAPPNDWSCFRRPGMFEDVSAALRGYAELADEKNRQYYYSQLAGFAWQIERYDDGRAALDAIDGKWTNAGFDATDALPARTVSGLYAMTGPRKDHVRAAERAASTGDLATAAQAYERLSAGLDPADQSAPWIHGRGLELKWQREFETGEWVSLMPTDSQLSGWTATAGKCELPDGEIEGTTEATRGAALICGAQFGPRYELDGTFEVLASPFDADPDGGPIFARISVDLFVGTWIHVKTRLVKWRDQDLSEPKSARLNEVANGPNHFQVMVWDDHGYFRINGGVTAVFDGGAYSAYAVRPDLRVGLGTSMKSPGVVLRFRDVKIRKSSREPPKD